LCGKCGEIPQFLKNKIQKYKRLEANLFKDNNIAYALNIIFTPRKKYRELEI
jgi:hypothetical protein